jgi:hypothetical protein
MDPQTLPIRVQFACYGVLVAEVIVQGVKEAGRVTNRLFNQKYAKGLPMGSSVTSRADLPRTWDVPVGSAIEWKTKAQGAA